MSALPLSEQYQPQHPDSNGHRREHQNQEPTVAFHNKLGQKEQDKGLILSSGRQYRRYGILQA